MKLFWIRVKELLEPIVLERKGDGVLLFLKAFSWETDLWVTLGDFMVKKPANLQGKSVFSWNRLSRNEMWYAADNYNYIGPFILQRNCVAVPIYWLLSAVSHRSFTTFQVKMNLTSMWHRNAEHRNFCAVGCSAATQPNCGVIWTELKCYVCAKGFFDSNFN